MTTDKDDDIDLVADSLLVNSSALGQIGELVEELKGLYQKLEAIEKRAKEMREDITKLEQVRLPEAMKSANTKMFTTTGGETVSLIDFIQVSIPSQSAIDKARGDEKQELIARREAAHNFLRGNGHAGLLKTDVIVSFGKDKEKEVNEIITLLKDNDFTPTVEEGVHPATLSSWAKEMKEIGQVPPENIFKTFVGNKAVIVTPRKKRK